MPEFDFDAVIVGAGAVGLACGYALSRRGQTVAVLEAAPVIGEGVSSRNSEVVHAGLYYPTGSLRARLCAVGRRRLYRFLDDHKVAFDRCGKLMVATTSEDSAQLERILRQARLNDVEGVARLSQAEATRLEPNLRCDWALLSRESGVFDSHGYMLALRGEIEAAGGAVVVSTPFEGARPTEDGGWDIRIGGREPERVSSRTLVTAAGLSSQRVAATIDGYPDDAIPRGYFGKGVYFRLIGKAPFGRLVYPAPIPGALGTHYRRDLGGQAIFGPDLAYVEEPDYDVNAERASDFYRDIRRFWPGLPEGALVPDYSGIRPKIHGPGEAQPDFRLDGPAVHALPGLVALFGIESPGLTCSLEIGEQVADMLAQ